VVKAFISPGFGWATSRCHDA